MKMPLAAGSAALLFCAALPGPSQARGLEQVSGCAARFTAGLRAGSLTRRRGETLRLELIRA